MIDFDEQKHFENRKKVINLIFKKLYGCFPSFHAIVNSQDQYDNMVITWHQAILQSGLFGKQEIQFKKIENGVNKMMMLNSPYAPSCGEFIAMCKEE